MKSFTWIICIVVLLTEQFDKCIARIDTSKIKSSCDYFQVESINTGVAADDYLPADPAKAKPRQVIVPVSAQKRFYKKLVRGLVPVVGSSNVSDEDLLATARTSSYMVQSNPKALQMLKDKGVYIVAMAEYENLTMLPEYIAENVPSCSVAPSSSSSFCQEVAKDIKGFAARWQNPFMAVQTSSCKDCSAWQIFCKELSPIVHEFAHAMAGHSLLVPSDRTKGLYPELWNSYDAQLNAFNNAKASGLFTGRYAMTKVSEYTASLAGAYFHADGHKQNNGGIDTREELKTYDPKGFAVVDKMFQGVPIGWQPYCDCSDEDYIEYPIPSFGVGFINEAPSSKKVDWIVVLFIGVIISFS